ncbi:MAG: acetolactate synthase large subunit [Sphingobium sp.]
MNGAEALVQTLVDSDVTVCFGNPGTSEMHFLGALDANPGIRCVLCLFEGVVSAAADGYGRMTGKPAATLLHLGPGLANAGANLHNAMRAGTPMVNIVGDHATYHHHLDAPLTNNIENLARTWSVWVKTSRSAQNIAKDAAEAVRKASEGEGGIATLILPADTAWGISNGPALARLVAPKTAPDPRGLDQAAERLRSGEPAMLLLGGSILADPEALDLADRIAQATGAEVFCETANARIERGAGRVAVEHVPYPVNDAVARLKDFRYCILIGARAPVAFFAYPDKPGRLLPEGCETLTLTQPDEDGRRALEELASSLDAGRFMPRHVEPVSGRALPDGPLTSAGIAASLANRLPAHAIISDESMTTGWAIAEATETAAPHSWLELTGGAIGIGLPLAIGAAVAHPDRKVVVLQADGSGMYTNQALWTHAREKLDIVSIILSNRSYAILRHELSNVGVKNPGRKALDMTSLRDPDIDWVAMGQSMGVPSAKAVTAAEFDRLLAEAFDRKGPSLIEAEIDA